VDAGGNPLPDFTCVKGELLSLNLQVSVSGGQSKANLGFWTAVDGESTQASGPCNHCYQPVNGDIDTTCAGFGGGLFFFVSCFG
jgi:hypothetical protein